MAKKEQVGIYEGKDDDGYRCWYGWGFSLFGTNVEWTHDINTPDYLYKTKRQAEQALARQFLESAAEEIAHAKAKLKVAKQFKTAAKKLKAGKSNDISLSLASHEADCEVAAELERKARKRQLRKELRNV